MAKSDFRTATVAGQFYPAKAQELTGMIEGFIDKAVQKTDALACMLPHAGYVYSGPVAVKTVSRLNIKDTVVLFGPNHTGNGAHFSIMAKGVWQTPLGEVEIDSELADKFLSLSGYLQDDFDAHEYEHSLEVELPILQYFKKSFRIVPIAIMSDGLSVLKEIGESVASAIKESGKNGSVLLIASSDMTHYEPQEQAARKDREAIEAILKLDTDLLTRKVNGLDISMCGYAPVCVMLEAAKLLGAKQGELVKYQTSGDVTGDESAVVGYAGIIIH